jgi:hypothetical protein
VYKIKYFAILLDCIRDAGRVRQMTIILRYVDTETVCIEEHFVGFVAVQETTVATLMDTIFRDLQRRGLDINDYRSQGYDNGANMIGVNSHIKKKILAINPKALFTSRVCHN